MVKTSEYLYALGQEGLSKSTCRSRVKQTQYASPFSFAWNTVGVPNGNHTVAAMAYDAVGTRACYAVTLGVKN